MARDPREREKSATEARQGRLGRPVLYVLGAALVLLAIYLVSLMAWVRTDLAPEAKQQQQQQSTQSPASSGQGRP